MKKQCPVCSSLIEPRDHDEFDELLDALENAVRRAACALFNQGPDFDPMKWTETQAQEIAHARKRIRKAAAMEDGKQ